MPTYQYACTTSSCGHRFEAVQAFSDEPLSACPVCDGPVRKVFSAVGVVFKGSGFYRNDSRNESRKRADGASGADGKAAGSSGSESTGSSGDKTPAGASASSSGSSGSTGSSTASSGSSTGS